MTLEINGVEKWFSGKRGGAPQHVLRNVDLEVKTGEFVSLIGHSGCGKSTLLNVIAGLESPSAGSVALDGEIVDGPGPDRAIVFQNYSLLPRLTLFGNVRAAVRAARSESAERADELAERYLTRVGLWEHRTKRPHEVSGGMQQRTAVARAFAVEPRILLLDEPFGALDALTRARLQGQLIQLWQDESGTETVVMVTHGIDEAIFLADRIVVMSGDPGPSVVDDIPVPIGRPRQRETLIDDPAYHEVYERLVGVLSRDQSLVA
ncbi:MAG TPA: ABC transporter ATP-binding protein [Acidimicrobiia bacterium]